MIAPFLTTYRIDIRSSYDRYDLILEWNTDPIFSHLSLSSVTMFSPVFSVSSSSLPAFFSPPPLFVYFNLLTVHIGLFDSSYRPNTSLVLLSLSFLFLFSFLFPLFSFFSPISSLSPPFLSFSLQIFGAATAAMPHRFRRAWLLTVSLQ